MTNANQKDQSALPPRGTGDTQPSDQRTAPNQDAAGEPSTDLSTPGSARDGNPRSAGEHISMVTFQLNDDTAEILADSTRDEQRADPIAAARLTLNKEFEAVDAFLRSAPVTATVNGRDHGEVRMANAVTSGADLGASDQQERNSARVNGDLTMTCEVLSLRRLGSTTTEIDPTHEAGLAALVMGQLLAGRLSSGVSAPKLATPKAEQAFRARVEPNSGCLHHAAVVPLLAAAKGWLMHMSGDPTKRSYEYWVNMRTAFAVPGWKAEGIVTSVTGQTAMEMTAAEEEGHHRRFGFDSNGLLTVSSDYATEALAHVAGDFLPETEMSGRYLLALPKCEPSVVAAAMALTRGRPRFGGAGHSQLMAAMSMAGVGYITDVDGSQASVPYETEFGYRDMLSIIGYAMMTMTENKKDVQDAAIRQVASLFRPATSSAHDWSNFYGAGLPVMARPFNEAAFDSVWDTTTTGRAHMMTDDHYAAGERFSMELTNSILLNCAGVANALYHSALMGPTAITKSDAIRMQKDALYNLQQAAFSAYAGGAEILEVLSRTSVKTQLPLASIAAVGIGSSGRALTPSHCPYVMLMLSAAHGCYYRRDDGLRLELITVDINYDNHDAARGVMAYKPGHAATARSGMNTITADQEAGGVVDCEIITQRAMFSEGTLNRTPANEREAAIWAALIAAAMTGDVSKMRISMLGDLTINKLLRAACADDATGQRLRSALGVEYVAGQLTAAQRNWDWRTMQAEYLDRDTSSAMNGVDNPFHNADLTPAGLARSGISAELVYALWGTVGYIRAEMASASFTENGAPGDQNGTGFSQAVAIGIVPRCVTTFLAVYGQCAFSGGDHKVVENACDDNITHKMPGDTVAPAVKTAILSATMAAANCSVGLHCPGGHYGTLGMSIVGDGTIPLPTVPWTGRTVAYFDLDHNPGAIETAFATNGDVSIKAKTTNYTPDTRYATYRQQVSYKHNTANNFGARAFGGRAHVGVGGATRNVTGPLAEDHRSAAKLTAASAMRGIPRGISEDTIAMLASKTTAKPARVVQGGGGTSSGGAAGGSSTGQSSRVIT